MRISDWSSDVCSSDLLNIVSKSPSFEFGANGEITYGNYDYWRLSGRVTGPVSQDLAVSLDGVYVKRDGFYDLIDTSGAKVGDTNDRDRYFLRGQALYEPNDALSIRLIGDYTHRDESRSEEHTSELQSLMRISYAVFCLQTKNNIK